MEQWYQKSKNQDIKNVCKFICIAGTLHTFIKLIQTLILDNESDLFFSTIVLQLLLFIPYIIMAIFIYFW